MSTRLIGFVLLSLGIVGVLAAFAFSHNYTRDRGLAWNLANRDTMRVVETVDCRRIDAPNPPCRPGRVSDFAEVEVFSLPLGLVVTVFVAVGLTGTGMLIFGGRPSA